MADRADQAEKCAHHRICGDILVEQHFPDFFATHKRSRLGVEWQVCLNCGDAVQVDRTKVRRSPQEPPAPRPPADEYDRFSSEMYYAKTKQRF